MRALLGADTVPELQPGPPSLFFQVPSDQRGALIKGAWGCTRMRVVLKKTQVSLLQVQVQHLVKHAPGPSLTLSSSLLHRM